MSRSDNEADASAVICGICGAALVPAAPGAGGGDLWEPHQCKDPEEILKEWRDGQP